MGFQLPAEIIPAPLAVPSLLSGMAMPLSDMQILLFFCPRKPWPYATTPQHRSPWHIHPLHIEPDVVCSQSIPWLLLFSLVTQELLAACSQITVDLAIHRSRSGDPCSVHRASIYQHDVSLAARWVSVSSAISLRLLSPWLTQIILCYLPHLCGSVERTQCCCPCTQLG